MPEIWAVIEPDASLGQWTLVAVSVACKVEVPMGIESERVHPPSVRDTEYNPALFTDMDGVVAPVDQENCSPEGLACNVRAVPLQMYGGLLLAMVIVGFRTPMG